MTEFDWDQGNREKCQRHGVTLAEIEEVFLRAVIRPDPTHSQAEDRLLAVGRTDEGRWLFVVFTLRESGARQLVRPISARYMHAKEIDRFEKANPELQNR